MTNAVITAQLGSTQTDYGFKNRVINGDFRIDQRLNFALQTGVVGGINYWLADRFRIGGSAFSTGRYSFQTVADAPAGFVNSGKITVTTAQTPAASDIQVLSQIIEGVNVSDFAWGTAGAVAVSLSFWVKANLSGQYVVAIRADNNTATYLGAYTITTANTWQYITISIPGCTFGTWGGQTLSTTIGIRLDFNLGTGTTASNASVNTWLAGDYFRTTSDVQLIQTLGATWQITGIQLEVGSSATGFDYRSYSTELAMCQRYYEYGMASGSGYAAITAIFDAGAANHIHFKTTKRAVPSMSAPSIAGNTYPNSNYSRSVPDFEGGFSRGFRYTTINGSAYWNVTSGNGGSTGVAGFALVWIASAEL